MTPGHAAVIGGSIGGLFAAAMLRRIGWSVRVFERAPAPLASRGAGIITHPELRALLDSIGLDTKTGFGVPVTERVVLGRDGREVARMQCPQIATSWDHVFTLLRRALPDEHYVMGAEFAGLEAASGGVTVRFSDGRTETASLMIGADGIRSALRAALAPEASPRYAGYAAWRGLLPEEAVPPALYPLFAFGLPPGEQVLGYPVAGEGNDLRPGRRRYNLVWYRPAAEATTLADLLTGTDGLRHAAGIPPTLLRPDVLAAMRAAARQKLAPDFAATVEAIALPLLQPIFDLESPRMAWERAVLLGDAAFVVRPHVGAGVTKAAQDAASLAAALQQEPDLPGALRRYEAERLPEGRRTVQRGRHLGSYLQASQDEEAQALALRHQTAEAVMAETALLGW